MPTNSHALLALAQHFQQLHAQTQDEAVLRAALSRFYFATLHCVAQTFKPLRSDSLHPPRSKDYAYEAVIGRVVAYGRTEGEENQPARTQANGIAKMLPLIKRMQVLADYDLAFTITTMMVEDTRIRCEQIVRWCNNIRQTTDKDQAEAVIP